MGISNTKSNQSQSQSSQDVHNLGIKLGINQQFQVLIPSGSIGMSSNDTKDQVNKVGRSTWVSCSVSNLQTPKTGTRQCMEGCVDRESQPQADQVE